MLDLLMSTTLLASFLGGVVALLAPCCVSVMLPAYFASTFRTRSGILAMTLVFAGGVATVIVPIALGASMLSRLFNAQHTLIFSIGGVLMAAMGVAMLLGWKMSIPMPGMPSGQGKGIAGTYVLGVFSGIASSCCAPVLAGVAVVSGAAGSFPAALTVGIAYVFGMVAPLAALALLWDKRDWGSVNWLARRTVPLGRRRVPMWSFLSGVLLVAMGVLTIVLAFTNAGMSTDGWAARTAAELRHWSAQLLDAVSGIPGIITSLAVIAALTLLIVRAVRGKGSARHATDPATANDTEVTEPAGNSAPSPAACCAEHEPAAPAAAGSCCGDTPDDDTTTSPAKENA